MSYKQKRPAASRIQSRVQITVNRTRNTAQTDRHVKHVQTSDDNSDRDTGTDLGHRPASGPGPPRHLARWDRADTKHPELHQPPPCLQEPCSLPFQLLNSNPTAHLQVKDSRVMSLTAAGNDSPVYADEA